MPRDASGHLTAGRLSPQRQVPASIPRPPYVGKAAPPPHVGGDVYDAETIELIRAHLNPSLHVSTILLTMYDGRTNLAQQVASEVREHFPDQTLRTTVPRSVRISEAPSHGQTVMTYDGGSTGALAYLEAARELTQRGANTGPASSPVTGSSAASSTTTAADSGSPASDVDV